MFTASVMLTTVAATAIFAAGAAAGVLASARGRLGSGGPGAAAVTGGRRTGAARARRHDERQFDLQQGRLALFACLRSDRDPDRLAESVLAFAVERSGADGGAFYLGRSGQRLVRAAERGLAPDGRPPGTLCLGEGVIGRLAARRRPGTLTGVDCDGLRLDGGTPDEAPGGLASVPFHLGGGLRGLLILAWHDAAAVLTPPCLIESGESVAVALDSAGAHARARRLLEATRDQAVTLARQQRELQASNAALARADRYKSEFLANMSHELRTPLNSMLIMAQVLAENRHGRLAEDEVDAALTINQAGSELLLIINDILDMSRVEAGKLDLQPDRVEPRTLVDDLDDLFRPTAERRDLVFRAEVAADAPDALVTDPLRLRQILKNLLSNAFKFTERGSVTLAVRPALPHELPATPAPGPWLAFAVTDTGIGMDEATAARVSEPFFQGDGSIGRRYGGSGLGLSICWRLAELLQGRMSVGSVPGRGSTFVLALPVAGALDATDDAPAPASRTADPLAPWAGRLAGRRVLLADDDMRTVYGLSHVLDRLGAQVHIARHRDEARALAARHAPLDLLCLAPTLFAAHEDDLRRLVADVAAPCVWLGDGPAARGPDDAVTLDKPLAAVRAAQICADLGAGRPQPA